MCVWQQPRTCYSCYWLQNNNNKKHFFHTHSQSSGQPGNDAKTLFPHRPSPLISPVILANSTVVASVLLRNSRFNFHCYTQREPTPTQKSARKWQQRPFATSHTKDYKGHSLMQTSFAALPISPSFPASWALGPR